MKGKHVGVAVLAALAVLPAWSAGGVSATEEQPWFSLQPQERGRPRNACESPTTSWTTHFPDARKSFSPKPWLNGWSSRKTGFSMATDRWPMKKCLGRGDPGSPIAQEAPHIVECRRPPTHDEEELRNGN